MFKCALLATCIALCGCTSFDYSSIKDDSGSSHILIGERKALEKSACNSIKRRIRGTSISKLADEDFGYSFYYQTLDRTDFKMVFRKARCKNESGAPIGWIYEIKAKGTNFNAEGIWRNDLSSYLEEEFKAAGGKVIITSPGNVELIPEE